LWLVLVIVIGYALGGDNVFTQIGLFFSNMAVVTFGGAYAVLAYMAQQAVETYGWLNPGEMLDGLGMAETTPGPLIMVVVGLRPFLRYPDPEHRRSLGRGAVDRGHDRDLPLQGRDDHNLAVLLGGRLSAASARAHSMTCRRLRAEECSDDARHWCPLHCSNKRSAQINRL
jgi:hypothetical protein